MKRINLIFVILLAIFLCGCSAWMNGYYASAKPHKEQNFGPEQVLAAPKTYEDIELILKNMVESGQQRKTISMEKMQGDWQGYVSDAVDYVKTTYPMGVYAVSDIDYEIGTNNGKPALAVDIVYCRSSSDIAAVWNAEDIKQVEDIVYDALCAFDLSVAIRMEDYSETDYLQMVEDYAIRFPQFVMETPQVSVMTYPEEGEDRIVELLFHYDTSRTAMRQMREQVDRIFDASEMYVSGDGSVMEKFHQLYSFLMNRYEYTIQPSITPSYSLLHHGLGDSKAFATVYGAMCRRAGLNCETVAGTRNGQVWYWNVLKVDGETYHVDLLSCLEKDRFFYCTPQELTDYVWDSSAY